jgi:glycosyltransferase involved in cell wall biosynthesis
MIPAYNEEKSIRKVISEIPQEIPQIDQISIIVIDDGSTDNTRKRAIEANVDKVISFKQNQGLALAFKKGLDLALEMNADIIVNIDADGQYDGKEITKLLNPILNNEADIVLGSRFKGWIEFMPLQKRIGNSLATKATNLLTGLNISDTQTGFRAFSKEAALRLNIESDYTYVQETIIQAVEKGLTIVEVPVHFRKREGKSRLISNIFSYARRAGINILRTYRDYEPLRTFLIIGGLIGLLGFVFGIRVLIQFLTTGMVGPYLPSAVLTAVLLIVGFQVIILGIIADMVGSNRKIQEEILYLLKKRRVQEEENL